MGFTGVLAQSTVSDLDRAVDWYTRLFGRGPDAQPMDGLNEWHFGPAAGIQVWLEPDRAGRSTTVLASTDLDQAVADLDRAGIEHPPIEPASTFRIVQLADPDGNRVVLTGD
jgi:catechol 2,3-dioxygenase-like lactoylglutathione lyase family enzyme